MCLFDFKLSVHFWRIDILFCVTEFKLETIRELTLPDWIRPRITDPSV